MAGQPRKRARAAAAEAATLESVPEAVPHAGAGDARVYPGGRTRARGAPTTVQDRAAAGPKTKEAGDRAQADAASDLALQLQPGIVVRIDRTKPGWCAGWQEDYVLESGDSGELLDYIKEEYGGRTYRLTALSATGAPLWNSKLNVGGKPKEEGRVLVRWQYEGEPNPDAPPPAPAAPAGAAPSNGFTMDTMMTLMDRMLGSSERAATAQLAAVKDSVRSSNEATEKLCELIVHDRSEERRGESLSGQLSQLVESSKAIKKAGSFFGAAQGDDGGRTDVLEGAGEQAFQHFFSNVLQSEFPQGGARANGGRGKPPPRQQRQRRAPQTEIPEAIPRPKPSS